MINEVKTMPKTRDSVKQGSSQKSLKFNYGLKLESTIPLFQGLNMAGQILRENKETKLHAPLV